MTNKTKVKAIHYANSVKKIFDGVKQECGSQRTREVENFLRETKELERFLREIGK
ncbi:hypothetical protein [Ferrovum myxofaciens]|uniref:Uncharacterized protein n=1 Tax=Ferrovum myxofaciens TaxID=416213 RepID=A0A9E6SY88_9PROT|nr:hypothetical protein [Ferrovum myxofaciens]QKE37313.1 MAG: hypothetical protein HO273_00050 [Ferrovum myxofaciens]QWY74958.1 MAG: hypothetical protein JVY19_00500 [Ferrovum myxofaciens]QWY77706.1 MAG: hypothetical protein JZL65_01055 [Ferrovum myxofaciens]